MACLGRRVMRPWIADMRDLNASTTCAHVKPDIRMWARAVVLVSWSHEFVCYNKINIFYVNSAMFMLMVIMVMLVLVEMLVLLLLLLLLLLVVVVVVTMKIIMM